MQTQWNGSFCVALVIKGDRCSILNNSQYIIIKLIVLPMIAINDREPPFSSIKIAFQFNSVQGYDSTTPPPMWQP